MKLAVVSHKKRWGVKYMLFLVHLRFFLSNFTYFFTYAKVPSCKIWVDLKYTSRKCSEINSEQVKIFIKCYQAFNYFDKWQVDSCQHIRGFVIHRKKRNDDEDVCWLSVACFWGCFIFRQMWEYFTDSPLSLSVHSIKERSKVCFCLIVISWNVWMWYYFCFYLWPHCPWKFVLHLSGSYHRPYNFFCSIGSSHLFHINCQNYAI